MSLRAATAVNPILAVAAGVLAFAVPIPQRAGVAFEPGTGLELRVTSGADAGIGSLREALFAASRATEPVRIIVGVSEISIRTALPPLLATEGVLIESELDSTRISGAELAGGPILIVQGRDVEMSGLRLGPSPDACVRVVRGALVGRSLRLEGCRVGFDVFAGASLELDSVDVRSGDIGVRIAPGAGNVWLHDSRLSRHAVASVWAVAAQETRHSSLLRVERNRFSDDRTSVVLANRRALVADNEFVGATQAGLYLAGAGAQILDNRVRDGAAMGILAIGTRGAVLEGNEIDGHEAAGIMLKSGVASTVRRNRSHGNGYGLIVVFGDETRPGVVQGNHVVSNKLDGLTFVGASPLVQGNTSVGNGRAGVRILDFLPDSGSVAVARPKLVENVVAENGEGSTVRGRYEGP